jgi:tetratricopeptide (TPR) repeat protein
LLNAPPFVGAAVIVLAAAVYLNALANGLVWDDPIILTRQLLAFQSLRDLIFLPRNIPQFSPDYYRPLTILTYLIDHAIGGATPFMFHFSVVVFHVVTTYLVFRFGMALFRGQPMAVAAAGFGAALFAAHPIHSESVAWGAGRSDVLACGFSLAGALVYLSNRQPAGRRSALAAGLIFAATLAKETAVPLLVLTPLSDMVLGRVGQGATPAGPRAERRRRGAAPAARPRWLSCLPFAAALTLYMGARETVLGSALGPATTFGIEALPQLIGAVGYYLGALVLPVRQSAYISDLPSAPFALLATIAAVLSLAVACALAWRCGERRVSFLLLWIAFTLAPALAIVLKIPFAPVAERYLYLPSVGYCLLFGYGAMKLFSVLTSREARAAVAVAMVALLSIGVAATVRRNAVWRSNLTLWQDTVTKNLTDGLPMRSLATTYQQLGDAAKAKEYFLLALQRRNDAAGLLTIYNNLGSLAMMEKKLDEAEGYYRSALAALGVPDLSRLSRVPSGAARSDPKGSSPAEKDVGRSPPGAADALFNLALIGLTRAKDDNGNHDQAWKHEQAEQARQLFEQAQQLSPLDPDIPVGLGQTLSVLGDAAGARKAYERALQLGLPPATDAAVRHLLRELG